MKETIFEVLMSLLENHLKDNQTALPLSEQALLEQLTFAGFGADEIDHIKDWLEIIALQDNSEKKLRKKISVNSFRPLTSYEQHKLGIKCWATLLFLERAGILDSVNRELVIERLMLLEPEEVDIDQVQWITLLVLAGQPDATTALKTMENLMRARIISSGIH